jgi:hypothetical protein
MADYSAIRALFNGRKDIISLHPTTEKHMKAVIKNLPLDTHGGTSATV